jgi:hypothetical protein
MDHLIHVTEAELSFSLGITIATIVRSTAFHMVGPKVGWVICVGSYRWPEPGNCRSVAVASAT